jgi:hypothetical protein
MPSADALLVGLVETANAWRSVAVAWHLLLAALLVALLTGLRLSTRVVSLISVASVLSVSALGWISANPFNGTMFATLAVALAGACIRTPAAAVQIDRLRRALPGAALVVFGWTYPHFVGTESWTEYLYAAPFGLIPCPTLSVVIGLTLLFRKRRTFAWTAPLIVAGLFYGIVGVFALEVMLDLALIGGTLILAAEAALDNIRVRSVGSVCTGTTS